MIAPFWDDIELTNTGVVEYGIVNSSNTSSIINEVETFLKLDQDLDLKLDWVMVAKWENVCPYGNVNCTQVNYSILFTCVLLLFIIDKHIPGCGCVTRINILCYIYL